MTGMPGTDRREFLCLLARAGAVAGAGAALGAPLLEPARAAVAPGRLWSQARLGRGAVVIDAHVVLDVDARVTRLEIRAGGSLTFAPNRSVSLTSTGNVVVRGLLRLVPAGPHLTHALRFEGVDETRFVGGGMDVLESDTGLWVVGRGRLQARGAVRTAWSRAAGSIRAGDTQVRLRAVPTGWRAGDEVAIVPTGSPVLDGHHDQYDVRALRSVRGAVLALDRPVAFSHPAVVVAPGTTMTAEVVNLTRNVRIEGTPRGRAHVFLGSAAVHQLDYVALRHWGRASWTRRGRRTRARWPAATRCTGT